MGAGKTTMAKEVARRLDTQRMDIDGMVEWNAKRTIAELFADGEGVFREHELDIVRTVLSNSRRLVIDLGGGAVTTPEVRELLSERAITIWLDEDVDTCWERVRGSDRPLAQDEAEFRRLFEERRPLYEQVADAVARDADDVVLAAAGVHVERGSLQRLGELVPGDGPVA